MHLEIYQTYRKDVFAVKRRVVKGVNNSIIRRLSFKEKLYPTISFATNEQLGLDYHFIAFLKKAEVSCNGICTAPSGNLALS